MSTAATLAGGAILVLAASNAQWRERLLRMQADMDHIAAGKLPIPPNGRNATAWDVQAYMARQRASVRG